MLLASIETLPGKNFEIIGFVKGTIVQSKHIGRDILAGLKTIVGGEISGYTDMLIEAREIATNRMVKEAEALGADAIIGIRYGSSSVMDGSAEILAYGTAIKFITF